MVPWTSSLQLTAVLQRPGFSAPLEETQMQRGRGSQLPQQHPSVLLLLVIVALNTLLPHETDLIY